MHDGTRDLRKYLPPMLPQEVHERTGLMEKMNRARAGRQLIVSAPSGYGKSVSVLLWLTRTNRQSVWINLDQYDNDPYAFYALFCHALLSIQPYDASLYEHIQSPLFRASPIELTLEFLTRLAWDRREKVLVFEDAHSITNPGLLASFPMVLNRLPASFLVVFITRNKEANMYDGFRQNDAVRVGKEDLAFSPEELAAYFAVRRPDLSAGEIEEIHATTGGWPMGIFALADMEDLSGTSAGTRILEEYFINTLWPKCDDMTKSFILACAAADVMSAALCADLAGRDDAQAMLQSLHAKNFFITQRSDGTFSFHPIILDLIRSLPEYAAQDFRLLHGKTARHFHARGEHFKAGYYAELSGDITAISTYGFISIYAHHNSYEETKYYATSPYSRFFSDALCAQYPFLYIGNAYRAFMCASPGKFTYYADAMYEHFEVIAREHPEQLGRYHLILLQDHRRSYHEASLWAARELFPRVGPDFRELLASSTYTHQFPLLHRGTRCYSELADPDKLEDCIRANAPLASGRNSEDLYYRAVQSGLLLEQNRVEEALSLALHTMGRADPTLLHELRFALMMHLAAACEAAGSQPELLHVIRETEKYLASGFPFLRPNLLAFKAKIQLWRCDSDAARAWLANYFVHGTDFLKIYEVYQYGVTLRALIVLGRIDEARLFLYRLRRLLADWERFLDLAEVDVLDAIMRWHLGEQKDAASLLRDVINRLRPFHVTKVISEDGASILPVLKRLRMGRDAANTALDQGFLSELLALSQQRAGRCAGIAAHMQARPGRLSRRQKLVLSLMAKGKTNKTIAEETGLSLHTVKYHARQAYAKLRVNRAGDAILIAKKRGYID